MSKFSEIFAKIVLIAIFLLAVYGFEYAEDNTSYQEILDARYKASVVRLSPSLLDADFKIYINGINRGIENKKTFKKNHSFLSKIEAHNNWELQEPIKYE